MCRSHTRSSILLLLIGLLAVGAAVVEPRTVLALGKVSVRLAAAV